MRKSNLLWYFQTGYGIVNLPLSLLSFATTTYYLMVNNIPALKAIFPRFELFLLLGVIGGVPLTIFVGWLYIRSEFNKASTRTHPFSTLLIPTQIPQYVILAKWARKEGFTAEADELEGLIQRSREKW